MKAIDINIKTDYELLSSLIKIDDLINYAKINNIKCLGITDSNMFGVMEFYTKCTINNIKPIIGAELNIDNINFILYAKNFDGYKNLCNVVSLSNNHELVLDDLYKFKDDIICVSDINSFDALNNIYDDIYIGYSNPKEKLDALVNTNNILFNKKCLYLNKEDKYYLKYLNFIKEDKTIYDDVYIDDNDYSMDSDIDNIEYNNLISFINKINLEFPSHNILLPKYSDNNEEVLINLINKGISKRLNGRVSDIYKERLNKEFNVIKKMGFINYFLIVYDYVLFAKKNGIIVGPGRGSACGSLISYALGITEIDPVKYDLIFERFLNPERVTMPDIDIDFDSNRRNEVISYIKEKYGEERVSNIITFGTLQSRQVIRSVGKVLNLSNSEIDNILRYIKDDESLRNNIKDKDFLYLVKSSNVYSELIKVCLKLEGIKKQISVHAAGIIISSDNLSNIVPLYKSGNVLLCGYTKKYLERLGLIKMDLLALKNLTIIDDILKLIKTEKNIDININKIDLEDKRVLDIFYNAETDGIFQFSTPSMKSFLKQFRVNSFNDIIAAIAINRPGPKEKIPSYIKRKEGKEKVAYLTPLLEPILKSTYGIIIYQEQVMEILRVLGGFSYSESDTIRWAMSNKKEDLINSYKDKFISGCKLNNIDIDVSNKIYDEIVKFSGYGFNKCHSVGYSVVSYQMAYLKAYYKEYFISYILNQIVGDSVSTKSYIDEAKVSNIKILVPNINYSTSLYRVINNSIVMPFNSISLVNKEIGRLISEERSKGKFLDFYDAVIRLSNINISKDIIKKLIMGGAFDVFDLNKNTMISNLDNVINYGNLIKDLGSNNLSKPVLKMEKEFSDDFIIQSEYKAFGFYLTNHPVTSFKRDNNLSNIRKFFDKYITLVLYVERICETITKKSNEKMCFISASDEFSSIDLVMFPKTYKLYNNIKLYNVIKVTGRVQRRNYDFQIVVSKIDILK